MSCDCVGADASRSSSRLTIRSTAGTDRNRKKLLQTMNWFGRPKKVEHSAVSSSTSSRHAAGGGRVGGTGIGGGGTSAAAARTNAANIIVQVRESIATNEKR